MEEFGDWLYIIIVIIATISSLFSFMRKKAQQTAEQNKPREIITPHSDEDDYWAVPTHQPITEEKSIIPVIPKRTLQTSYTTAEKQKKTFLNIHQEGLPSLKWENHEFVEPNEEYDLITFNKLPDNADEWRKAFIYNEIFNRKN